jgi:hypothetical protein
MEMNANDAIPFADESKIMLDTAQQSNNTTDPHHSMTSSHLLAMLNFVKSLGIPHHVTPFLKEDETSPHSHIEGEEVKLAIDFCPCSCWAPLNCPSPVF